MKSAKGLILLATILMVCANANAATVKIGLNYPKTGPYSVQGTAQLNAAILAVQDINSAGGILGRKVELVIRDSKSKAAVAKKNVEELIDKAGCDMIFGGSASSVAIAGGKAAKSRRKLYFGTLTYSNATTGKEGHKYMFRECSNAWMGAKVLSDYLRANHAGKKYFYVVADYTWGWTTEESIRSFSLTLARKRHKRALTPFPGATDGDFKGALAKAEHSGSDVLVLVLFGNDMSKALRIATEMGLKKKMAIVVPNLTLGMAHSAGPKVMEGVVGALPWCWKVPYKYGYERGIRFVEEFAKEYEFYPSTSAASAYTILYEYKDAVERAGTFETRSVIKALEGHSFVSLKDEQTWQDFDHQCVQTVYAVKCKSEEEVLKDKFEQDYFEIMTQMSGREAAIAQKRWVDMRKKEGRPPELEW